MSAALEFNQIPDGVLKERLAASLRFSQRSDSWLGQPLPRGRVTIEMVRAERKRIDAGLPRTPLPEKIVPAITKMEKLEAVRYPKEVVISTGVMARKGSRKG
jgi:hypothetical protein